MCTSGNVSTRGGGKRHRKGKKQKPQENKGSRQEQPPLNSHRDPPQSSQLASLQNQIALRGLFSEPWLSGGVDTGGLLPGGLEQVLGGTGQHGQGTVTRR